MNIEIANRLVQLRKKNNLSQEELAAKLGISRQAVSKWERAESSPDTDNLILLARLYRVSLDELLKTDGPVEPPEPLPDADAPVYRAESFDSAGTGTASATEHAVPTGGGAPNENAGPRAYTNPPQYAQPFCHAAQPTAGMRAAQTIAETAPILSVLVLQLLFTVIPSLHSLALPVFTLLTTFLYLALGFCFQQWHPGWLIFLMIPIFFSGIVSAFPVFITILYLLVGFLFNKWHPGWILYLTIPIFYALL